MPVGDIIETATVCWTGTQNMINVLHWRVQTVTPTEPTAVEKANAISTFMATQLKAMISTGDTYKGLKYRLVGPAPTAIILSTTGNGAGSRTGDRLPSQCAGLLSLRSSVAPPRVRGRFYLPRGVETDNAGDGSCSAGWITDAGLFWSSVFTSHTLTGSAGSCTISPVIWRRPPISTFYVIDSVLVRTNWATQRRRSNLNRGDSPAM